MKKPPKIVNLGPTLPKRIVAKRMRNQAIASHHFSLVQLRALAVALVAVLGLVTGCAYHVGSGDRQIPGGYRLVAVPVFTNLTEEAGAEVYFTSSMVREFERSKIARVVDKSAAQVTIEGTIDSIVYNSTNQIQQGDATPQMPAGTVLTTEYRILLTSTVRLRRNSDQKVIWEGQFAGERSYLAPKILTPGINSANALFNHSARYQNLELMAADLMSQAHGRLTENF